MSRLAAPDRRRHILAAAVGVFAQTNFRGAGVAEIAARAGISEPLIYRHFPSKKALFCEILEGIGQRIIEIWAAATAEARDALEALERAGAVYVENLRDHPAEAALQFQALAEARDPEIARVLKANHRAYLAFFEALIERGRREGVIRADVDARVAAWILDSVGFSLSAVDLLDLGDVIDPDRVDRAVADLLDWLSADREGSHDDR